MKMRKIMALGMAALMTMSVFAGCGSKDNTPADTKAAAETKAASGTKAADSTEVQDVSLKVWVPEEEVEITNQMCEAFDEAHPEYNCTFEVSIVGIDESVNLLTSDPDLAADVMIVPSGSLPQVVEAGLVYPITYDAATINSLYSEGALEACSSNGMLYAVPSSPNSWFMYYNTDLYGEDDIKSLETMLAKDLGDDVANFSCTISNSWYIEAFFYAAGCTLFGEDGTDPTDCSWNDENGFKAGQYLIDLANNDKYVEDQDGLAGSLFKDGKLGALCSGTWAAPELKEALGDKLGAAPLPTVVIDGEEKQLSNFADYKCHVVKSSTTYPLAAQQFVEWLDNEDNQLLRYEECSETPTCLSLQDNEELSKDVATVALIAQTEFATPQPSISQVSQYWDPVKALGEGIVNGEITESNLQSSLDSVVDSITSTLVE